jgi:GT2 family glycosyltransferase
MWNKKEVSYEIVEVELGRPLIALTVPQGRSGLACVVRSSDRPVGFFMEPLREGTVLSPRDVAARIMKRCGAQILREKIYEELRGPLAQRRKQTGPRPSGSGLREAQNRLGAETPFPSLHIAICTHDRPDVLARCLESLRSIGASESAGVHVLVVDNAPSNDWTARLVAGFPGVSYILERKPGLDFARNRAVREATAEWIAFLDDDVVVDRGWLDGLGEALTANPDAGAVTGPVLPLELEIGGFGANFDRIRFGPALAGMPTYPCGAGMFGAGCNMVFSRRILLDLGGFDDALDTGAPLPGGGDLDMFYRVVRAGHPLVREPRMLIYHQHRREYAKLRHQMWTWGLGSMAYVTKSLREDPSYRPKILHWILWWFAYQLSKLFAPYLRRNRKSLPWDLTAAEIAGGIVGLFGEYDRSRKRIEALRRDYA